MQRLDEIVEYYVKVNTNFAMMITGDWGVGKTYYFKNVLKKQISETPTFSDAGKNYRPILISLFGLKSIEEIQAEIFLLLYPILKNKVIKLGASIGKSLIKGILKLNNLGEYTEYVSEVDVDKEDWIKFNELVLCFDDLERISSNLRMEEFIGYINSLVENENVKVILIANENKIDDKDYYILKEKIVGNSIEFIPDLSSSYDSLTEVNFSGSPSYLKFLAQNKEFILNVFTKKSSNLRVLSFVLSYFQNIFSQLSVELVSHKILKEKENEILKILLKFSLAISIEYKDGKISFTKTENLENVEGLMFSSSLFKEDLYTDKKEVKEEDKPYNEKFKEEYFSEDKYHYFKSIYDFITGGSILKIETLIKELKDYYHIEENKVLPQYEIYNALNYPSVFSLDNKTYIKLTKQLLEYSDKGVFDIGSYLTIFYFSTRFNNLFHFNLEKLEKRIIKGMKKGKANYEFNPSLSRYLRYVEDTDYKDHLSNIRKAILDLNKEIGVEKDDSNINKLENLCYDNFDAFQNEILKHDSSFRYNPIFHKFNPYNFYLFFLRADNPLRWSIVRFWNNRYYNLPYEELRQELVFLEKLNIRIEKKILSLPKKGITSFVYKELNKELLENMKLLKPIT